jgi:hypothetical protein
MFQIKVLEKIKTEVMFNNFFFSKISPFLGNVEKCGGAREAKDENMVARCVLD